MASLIDSEAVFKERLSSLGIRADVRNGLSLAGFDTYGAYAYSFSQPGQKIEDSAFNEWVSASISANARLGEVASLKRLLFEAHTYVLADLRTRVVPEAERSKRLKTLRDQLPGILIEGPLEPSHSLLELCCSQAETKALRYIAPEKCLSRVHEITHGKTPSKQVELEADKLVVKEKDAAPDMAAHTALQLQEALKRRGLAYQFAGALRFQQYDRYLTQLFHHMHREPPSGYTRVSASQLVAAHKLVFQRLIEEGIVPSRNDQGSYPMDGALTRALESYEVSFALLPLPARSTESKAKPEGRMKSHAARPEPYTTKGAGKGKGKQGRKGTKPFFKVPQAIHAAGGKGATTDGRPICYNYNLEGCSAAAAGAACPRGLHVCAICNKAHPLKDHPKA